MEKITYPITRRDETVFQNFHGTKITNKYAWLEDPESEETKTFVEAQNELTLPYIKDGPTRNKLKERLTELWNFPKYSCPFKRGSRYFYYFNSGLQNQRVLYVQDSLTSTAEVFLDPNTFCKDGLESINGMAFSENGEICAYGLSSKGSDWITIKFVNVASKQHLKDELYNVKFSCMAWTHDHLGMFYNKYEKDESKQDGTETTTNLNQKLYYHLVGHDQKDDVLIAEYPDHPKWMSHVEVSDDGRFVILSIHEGCDPVNRLYYFDLSTIDYKIAGALDFKKIVDNFDASYDYITNNQSIVTFKTNLNAPRYKLININLNNYEQENWKDLVEENAKDVLEWCACVNQKVLVMCYLHDVKNKLYLHDLQTGERFRDLPLDVGSITGYSGKKEQTEIFYAFTSFLSPGTIYRCDLSGNDFKPEVFRETHVNGFKPELFQTSQVFYASKDGTKIPMFIIHKKGLKLSGDHPCYLYGYGGFNISITPSFSVSRLVYIQHLGGVMAIANIRGGGEYGERWHKDGCFDKKQNVFDDFICAAEYLIQEKFTSPERLTICGGSNGGLLVTACMNQRPELFQCVIGHVSVTDMLNFHRYTIGHAWTTDFGCADNEKDFRYLVKYSPLHNVSVPPGNGQYPSVLLLTADHDDRVVPLHSYKLIAQLQDKLGSSANQRNPLLIRIDTESGHGAGKPTSKTIDELSDVFSFIADMVGAKWSD